MDNNYIKFIGSQTTINSRIWGKLQIESVSFTPASDGDLAVFFGDPFVAERPLVRIHSECVFGEIFDSDFCDCADQLYYAIDLLRKSQHGILFYLRFDGRGAGLSAKVKATELEMSGLDTYESRQIIGVAPEGRDFYKIGEYLLEHGIKKITLLTNNPEKADGLRKSGIDIFIEPLYINCPNENVNKLYETKAKKFHHNIPGYSME